MAKPELGTKRLCAGCNAKFYDLNRDPIVCPTCQSVFAPPKPEPVRARRIVVLPPVPPIAVVAPEAPQDAAVAAIPEGDEDAADAGVPMLEELDDE